MRWPFVSRAAHEALRANAEALRGALQEERSTRFRDGTMMEQERARYDDLLEKYHALRVSGANAPQSVGLPPAQRPAKPADEAIETVVARFGGNSRLRRQLQKYVYTERMKPDADEDKIAESVLVWRDPEDDEDVA
jgi:hypothetical protein